MTFMVTLKKRGIAHSSHIYTFRGMWPNLFVRTPTSSWINGLKYIIGTHVYIDDW